MQVSHAQGSVEYRETPRMDETNQFALEMDHMAECVQSDKTPFTPGEEGLQDHRIMAAIYEAARTGRPVKLPAVTGLDVFRGKDKYETLSSSEKRQSQKQ
jgi:predicted dehydrogenase